MSIEGNDNSPKKTRARDFRFVASDVFGLSLSENGVKIIFGIEDMDGVTLEQSGVMLTLKSAKTLAGIINAGIVKFEQDTNTTISINEDARKAIEAALTAGKRHQAEEPDSK